MIAYISGKGHGLAIALADATQTFNSGALQTTPTAVSGGTWRMPSRTDWENMFTACGVTNDGETSSGNWTNKGFRDKLTACVANVQTGDTYWSSSNSMLSGYVYCVYFDKDDECSFKSESKSETPFKVRAVLEF